jgi:hypothetical protein
MPNDLVLHTNHHHPYRVAVAPVGLLGEQK